MNAMPHRVQLSRRKGWRMPPDTIGVARPGPWGNPYRVGDAGPDGRLIATRAEAVNLYRRLVTGPPAGHRYEELAGMNLACWCPLDGPCHADVLLERANASATRF
jgi:hypothetical protein